VALALRDSLEPFLSHCLVDRPDASLARRPVIGVHLRPTSILCAARTVIDLAVAGGRDSVVVVIAVGEPDRASAQPGRPWTEAGGSCKLGSGLRVA